jgi:proteasome accessory factor C
MPKQEIDGEELFNLALSIVGLVLRDGPMLVSELSEHFGYSEKVIIKAAWAVANSEDLARYETHFYLDEELLDAGEISFSSAQGKLEVPPVLSKRQVSALATGLDYLAALPQFDSNPDLIGLRKILGSDSKLAITTFSAPRASSVLGLLQQALAGQFRVRCEYTNQLGERSSRDIDPLRIDFLGQRHYLRGWCLKNHAVRSFRLDRVFGLELMDIAIGPDALGASIPEDVFGDALDEQEVEISASLEAQEIFWNFPTTSQLVKVGDRQIGSIRVGNLAALGRHIARYGGQVLVLGPESAIEAVRLFAISALQAQDAPKDED